MSSSRQDEYGRCYRRSRLSFWLLVGALALIIGLIAAHAPIAHATPSDVHRSDAAAGLSYADAWCSTPYRQLGGEGFDLMRGGKHYRNIGYIQLYRNAAKGKHNRYCAVLMSNGPDYNRLKPMYIAVGYYYRGGPVHVRSSDAGQMRIFAGGVAVSLPHHTCLAFNATLKWSGKWYKRSHRTANCRP